MTTEMSEFTMRLRSWLRCSKKVIAPPGSSGGLVICVLDSDSGTDSGRMLVVIMRSFLGIRDRRSFGIRLGRLFRRARDRFGHRSNYQVLRRAGFKLSIARWRGCYSGPFRDGRRASLNSCSRSGDSLGSLLAFGLEGLALHLSHFFFKGALEISGGPAELCHHLAQPASKLPQLLWPENDQDHDKQHNHVE